MEGNVPGFYTRAKEMADQTWTERSDWSSMELSMDNFDVWVFHNACFVSSQPLYEAADWAREIYEPQDDSQANPYGEGWYEARQKALRSANEICEDCGLTMELHRERHNVSLHVHHKTPVRTFDDYSRAHKQSNLEVLCIECHQERHANDT